MAGFAPFMTFLALLSAVLNYFSFPNACFSFGFWPLSLFFAVPLMAAFERTSLKGRLILAALYALTFYLLLTGWFAVYHTLGFLLFVLSLAIQPMVFALFYIPVAAGPRRALFYLPALWVVSEGVREGLMNGFSWGLGYGVAFSSLFSQAASWGGSQVLSFMLILVNVCLYGLTGKRQRHSAQMIALSGVALIVVVAYLKSGQSGRQIVKLKAAVVQPNTDYCVKSNLEASDALFDALVDKTDKALKQRPCDLVIWPETSVPADVTTDPRMRQGLSGLAKKHRTYLLVGTALTRKGNNYNSAVLFAPDGGIQGVYDKRILVPFSEYVPWGRWGRAATRVLKLEGFDFEQGNRTGLLTLKRPGGDLRFGVLICSEDTVGKMVRDYTVKGADFIVVLANDGWFNQDEALVLHAQNAVMHAIESGVPVIRATNTGWSCAINGRGHVDPIDFRNFNRPATLFFELWLFPCERKRFLFHDIFSFLCFGFVIIIIITNILKGRSRV